jgi:hypothetical protein
MRIYTPLAQGILTNDVLEDILNKFPLNQKAKHQWILLLLDCWLSTFYKTIWLY